MDRGSAALSAIFLAVTLLYLNLPQILGRMEEYVGFLGSALFASSFISMFLAGIEANAVMISFFSSIAFYMLNFDIDFIQAAMLYADTQLYIALSGLLVSRAVGARRDSYRIAFWSLISMFFSYSLTRLIDIRRAAESVYVGIISNLYFFLASALLTPMILDAFELLSRRASRREGRQSTP